MAAHAARPVIHVCEALGGGVLGVVRALANGSAEAGRPTTVIYGRRPETPEDVGTVFHPSVVLLQPPGWGSRKRGGFAGLLAAMTALRRVLRQHPDAVVHAHSSFAGGAVRLMPAAMRRVCYTPHAYAFLDPRSRGLPQRLAPALEAALGRRGTTIACSRAEGETAARLVGARRVVVVQNGIEVDDGEIAPPPSENGARARVVSVGRAAFQRLPDAFVEVARRCDGVDAEFIWVGGGVDLPILQEAGVTVTGWVPRETARAQLREADVVLHLAAYEGLPLALLEAMAAGRAIVASDLPPIAEALGSAGVLVGGAGDAAAAVRRLVEDRNERRRLGDLAAARVRRLFTEQRMVDRMLAVYDSLSRT